MIKDIIKPVDVRVLRDKNGEIFLSSTDLLKVFVRDLIGTGDYDNDPVVRNTADYIDEFMDKLTKELKRCNYEMNKVANEPIKLV